ncbi:hypothetical protein ACHAXS_007897 [Conticribra weissflogii]
MKSDKTKSAPKKANATRRRNMWTEKEDILLRSLVKKITTPDMGWHNIAAKVTGRSAKQCRERWVNHLQPNLKKGNWTEEEHALIVSLQEELGNQWSKIASNLEGRTDSDVKNYWYSMKKRRRRVNKPWTEQEDAELKALHSSLGNKWKRISATIGRSVGEVKSRCSRICVQQVNEQPLTASSSRRGTSSVQENKTSFNSKNKIGASDAAPKPFLLTVASTSTDNSTTGRFVNLLPGFSAETRHVNETCLLPFSPLLRSSKKRKTAATARATPLDRPFHPPKLQSYRQSNLSHAVAVSIDDATPANVELVSFQGAKGGAGTEISDENWSPQVYESVQKRISNDDSPNPHLDLFFDQFENRGPSIGVMNDTPLRSPLQYALFTPEMLHH